jgi:hypothetical protein
MMNVDNTHYLTELNPLISYRWVTTIEEILERIYGTPEKATIPEEKH